MNQTHPEYEAILRTLRKVCKQRKITFAQIAASLSLSEQTVKRLFAGAECPGSRLFTLCDLLGVSFASIVEEANVQRERTFSLTEEQEQIFAVDERLYAFFSLLLEKLTPDEIRRRFHLTTVEVKGFVQDLKAMNLATVDPVGRVLLRPRGTHNLRVNGPLSQRYALRDHTDFLQSLIENPKTHLQSQEACLTSSSRRVSRATLREMVREAQELFASFRRRATREESLFPEDQLLAIRWLAALAPFPSEAERIFSKPQPLA